MKYLPAVLIFVLFAACSGQPVEIYPMSNLWDTYKESKHEYYVLYNIQGKSPQEIESSIVAFNRETIQLDTILKYRTSYWRRFYPNTNVLTRDYKEEGRDAIQDHAKETYLHVEWRGYRDSLIYVWYGSQLTNRREEYTYKLSKENLDSVLNPIRPAK